MSKKGNAQNEYYKPRRKSVGEKLSGTVTGFFKLVLLAGLIAGVVMCADGYTTSVAPSLKRCEICGQEVSTWYTLSMDKTDAWDKSIRGEGTDGDYFAPYVLCPDCAQGIKGYLAWRMAGSP